MNITIAFVIASVVATAFFVYLAARGRAESISDVAELQGRTQPIDLIAFRNLIDSAEEQYLRDRLPGREFRKVRRQRLWAAIAYMDCVAVNAAVLLRLGEAARRSPNPEVAAAGLRLVNDALRVRLYATWARARFYAAILLPAVPVSPASVSELYDQMNGTVSRLGYLQHGSAFRRVAAVL
jgi:hypothetical protein